jgi:hypothetical protein
MCRFRCISLMAQLSLTPKWRAAARQEWHASTKAVTRTRRSKEKLWVMIHLLFSEGNHISAQAETL